MEFWLIKRRLSPMMMRLVLFLEFWILVNSCLLENMLLILCCILLIFLLFWGLWETTLSRLLLMSQRPYRISSLCSLLGNNVRKRVIQILTSNTQPSRDSSSHPTASGDEMPQLLLISVVKWNFEFEDMSSYVNEDDDVVVHEDISDGGSHISSLWFSLFLLVGHLVCLIRYLLSFGYVHSTFLGF